MNPTVTPTLISSGVQNRFRRILGVHTSGHDASVAVIHDGIVIEIVEFERLYQEKRYRIYPDSERFDRSLEWLFNSYRLRTDFDAVAFQLTRFHDELYDTAVNKLRKYIKGVPYFSYDHHLCHAASTYFTSPFERACILSFDSWGNDGYTVTFTAKGNNISYLKKWPLRLGTAYRALGQIIGGIHDYDLETSGKTMGLTAYGKANPNWKSAIHKFIRCYRPRRDVLASWEPSVADGCFELDGFGPVIGANTFDGPENVDAQNFAATFQECWSEIVVDIVTDMIAQSKCGNLCITGGGALNAITNYQLLKIPNLEGVHFIPNPSDAGIAMGAALYCYFNQQNVPYHGYKEFFSPYIGLPVLDAASLPQLACERGATQLVNPASSIAALLAKGLIIGIIHGRSEIGPRALGNRSILCDPRNAYMKTTLNERVKGREWYRPFAPVVQIDDMAIYFDVPISVPYMSVIGNVKDEWHSKIPAVTHVDNTARVQTVSKDCNEFLWEILGHFRALTGVGVLLNTSFNGKGRPMVTTLTDALQIMDETELDAVYSEGWLFKKKKQ